jgi:hypothetical protein
MKPFINFFLFMLTVASLAAQPAKIIVFRHAEEAADGSKESLSIRGQERAMALVPMLTQTPGLIPNNTQVVMFATKISRHTTNNHTHETLEPLACQLGLKIDAPYANSDSESLARHILTSPAYKDKTVLICWTHSHIPELLVALGITSERKPWPKEAYDRLIVVTYSEGAARMVNLPQKLLFGDSRH